MPTPAGSGEGGRVRVTVLDGTGAGDKRVRIGSITRLTGINREYQTPTATLPAMPNKMLFFVVSWSETVPAQLNVDCT